MKKPQIKKNKSSIWYLVVFIAIFVSVIGYAFFTGTKSAVSDVKPKPVELAFSDVLRRSGDIKSIKIDGTNAAGTLADGSEFTAIFTDNPEILEKLATSGATVSIENSKSWLDYGYNIVWVLVGLLFIWWLVRGPKMGGIGRSLIGQNPTKITTGKPKTTFKDVAGIDSEKQELTEIVEFLKDRKKFQALGARVPRGILLSGGPGTGKTLLARAIAGEANVPFFAASGSDFSGIIVGLGVAKIKEIFEMAKRSAPAILFIDEIDAIGQKRSTHSFNDQDREQTLNQLLIEMDGFSNETGIIVIGATNRPDMLDPALLRPGRFDRQVHIELPDMRGRREILDLYAKKVKIADGVDLQEMARGTTGFSGADLENLLNEAALHAVRAGHKKIEQSDLDEARDKIMMGPVKLRKMRPEDIKLTAYHEAGHAFVSNHYKDITDPIHKATIIPRGRALGMVQHLPIDDKVSMTLMELRASLSIYLAGRASEEVFFGADKITTGAESDIAAATRMTRMAITVAGMSKKIGPIAVNQVAAFGGRAALENASEKTAEAVDAEVRAWMDAAHRDASSLIAKNKPTVKKLADELLKRETLTGDEIAKIIGGHRDESHSPKSKKTKTGK